MIDDERVLAKHRLPRFETREDHLIYVKCACGWEGYFDPGDERQGVDWMTHLYIASVREYEDE